MVFQETEKIELKSKLTETISKEIVAFLNSFDGTIYIGVKDNGDILGVTKLDDIQKQIADIITTQILPNPQELIEIGSIYVGGKNIVKIEVKKGNSLYYIKKYGRSSSGCYIRVGTSCRSMTEEQIERLYSLSISLNDNSIIDTENYNQDLTFSMLKNYYVAKDYHINEKTFYKNYKLVNKSNKFNLLANLMADENDVSIKVVRFAGKTKGELIEKSEYGFVCLLLAIDKVIARLDVINITKSSLDGGARRKDKRLLDARCLREAFLNAVAHNDWTSKVSPIIYVYSNRIEIVSTGGLPKNLSIEEFYNGCSKPRCPELMRILSDLEYVEQSGFGINKIIEIYGKDVFNVSDNFITVTLPFDSEIKALIDSKTTLETTQETTLETTQETTQENLSDLTNKIIKIISKTPAVTTKEIAEKIGVTVDGAKYHLKKLKELGIIEHCGATKTGYWKILK